MGWYQYKPHKGNTVRDIITPTVGYKQFLNMKELWENLESTDISKEERGFHKRDGNIKIYKRGEK
jgi:hypothetical protein